MYASAAARIKAWSQIPVACLLFLATDTAAQTIHVWDGGAASSNDLSDSINWSGDSVPSNDGSVEAQFPDSPRPNPIAALAWDFNGVVFNGTSTVYTVSGSPLTVGASGILNFSPLLQTINNNLTISANQIWGAVSGDLECNGVIAASPHTVTLQGSQDVTLNSAVSGVLRMQGSGDLMLAGTNTMTGLTVHSGTLKIDTNQPVGLGRTVTLEDGSRMSSQGTYSCNMNVAVSGHAWFVGAGALAFPNLVGGMGDTLTVDGAGDLELQGGSFAGHLRVESGSLLLNRVTPAPVAEVFVGTGFGTPISAVVRTLGSEQLASNVPVSIQADGQLDLQGGKQTLNSLTLDGGLVTGVELATPSLQSLASSRMASVQSLWSSTGPVTVMVADGTPFPDLEITADIAVPAGEVIQKVGGGTLRLTSPSLGNADLLVSDGILIVATNTLDAELDTVTVDTGATLIVAVAHQLGEPSCVALEAGAILTLEADNLIGNLKSAGGDARVNGSGVLALDNSIHEFGGTTGSTLLNVPVDFQAAHPRLILADSATVDLRDSVTAAHELSFRGPVTSLVRALSIDADVVVLDGPELQLVSTTADLEQTSGVLSPRSSGGSTGELSIGGDWIMSGGDVAFEFLPGLGPNHDEISVAGTAQLGGSITIVNTMPIADGSVFTILTANAISGTFTTLNIPLLGPNQAGALFYFEDHIDFHVLGTVTDVPGDGEPSAALPTRFVLGQNSPNPFNPSTTIAFDVPQPTAVELLIFNAAGRHVRSLVSQRYGAGRHEVVWNGRDDQARAVPSGVYFYRLLAGPFRETRRMVLLR